MGKLNLVFALIVGIAATGCESGSTQAVPVVANAPEAAKQDIQQERLCEVDGWQHDIAKQACTPGQKIVFLPARWGNEQLPILFAAVNCDMRYSIALTNGGVACIYAPIQVAPTEAASPQPDPPKAPEAE